MVLERVTKRFGSAIAVDGISLEIEAGTLVTLVGPSGCGKTTTLRMIAGLELASEGRILIGGRDVTRLSATERDVTMVFQSYALFPHMTVLENVAYGLKVKGRPKDQIEAKAKDGLRLVGLDGFERRLPSALSGGQQQRVAVARALVLEPEVLLFDEPLSNLDARLRRRMREDIRELQQELGVTSVYVTHDRDEALSVSDRIVVMDRGRIAQLGTPRELYEAPRSPFVARFMGEANLLEGVLSSVSSRGELARVRVGGIELDLARRGAADGPVTVAIRPEAVRLEAAEQAENGALVGIVKSAVYLGSHMEYSVETEAGDLFVQSADVILAHAPKSKVSVRFAEGGVAIIPERDDR